MKLAELMDAVRRAAGNEQDRLALKHRLEEQGIHLDTIYQELEMSSSYADAHRDISTSSQRIQPHSHSFFELIFCCNCDDVQYILGTQRYRLQNGDVLIIPPGVNHCPLLPEEMKQPYERIVVWVNADLLTGLFQRWPQLSQWRNLWSSHCLLRTAGTCWENPIAEAFTRSCCESENRQPGWETALYGNTTLLITLLNRALLMEHTQPTSETDGLLEGLLSYVQNHLRDKITVSSAAHALLVSESTITHLCTKRLGVSFYQYVIHQRLLTARQLMQSNLPLGQIWERAGFCDYTAFYRAFRQEYGISPREYRSLQQQKNLPPI